MSEMRFEHVFSGPVSYPFTPVWKGLIILISRVEGEKRGIKGTVIHQNKKKDNYSVFPIPAQIPF